MIKSRGALLLLSLSITSGAVHPGAAVPLIVAQATSNPSAPNCQINPQPSQATGLDVMLGQVEPAIASGRVDDAAQLLVRALQQIRTMPNSSAKIDGLERLVGSIGANVAYTSPLEQLVQAVPLERSEAAVAALSSAVEVTQTLSSGYSASKTRTLVVLANYFTQLGQTHRSLSLLEEAISASNTIQGTAFKTIALSNIAEAYIRAGQPDAAAAILERSLPFAQAINHANPHYQASALARIANLYTEIARLDRALSIAQSIQEPSSRLAVMLAIANRYGEMGEIDRALELLRTVQQPEQEALALAAIAGRATAQQPQRASQLYADAMTTARSLPNASEVIANLALRYVEAGGLVATADETVQAIANSAVQAPALGRIALAYAKAGQDDRAEALLSQAIEGLRTIVEEGSRNVARQQLIDQAIQNGRYDYALQIAQTIQSGEEEVPFDQVDVLTQIAERAIAANRYDAALQVTEQIPPSFAGWRDRLFLSIARGLVQSGELDRAVAIAQPENADPSFQARLLAVIAAEAKLSGQAEQSSTLFNQAIQLANQIDYASTKIEALGAIAQAYLTAGQPEQATPLLNQAIAASQTIEDITSRSYSLRTISEQLTAANHYQAAIQVAEAIPDESERLAKLNEALEKALNAEAFTTILTALSQSDNPVFKTRWFLAIADRYMQQNELAQAATVLNQALQTARMIPGDESQMITVRGGESPLVVDDEEDRGSFLMAIALRYAQMGQTPQAQQIAQTLEDATSRQQLIQQINCYR